MCRNIHVLSNFEPPATSDEVYAAAVGHSYDGLPLEACGLLGGDPATARARSSEVKPGIHPDYVVTEVTCTCGSTFTTRSTAKSGVIHADICSNCHPFYTGKQKILDTGGRVARFERRFGKKASGAK